MLESSELGFWYLSPNWTRSPSCTRSLSGTRSSIGTGIALRCDPGSSSLSRHPTLCKNISQDRNPRRSRSPSSTMSLTGTRSP